MSPERQNLLNLAITVGLVLGVDFEKNISNINLQKKIEDKQEELANGLKGGDGENKNQLSDNFESEEQRLATTLKAIEDGNLKEEDLSDYDKELLSKHRQGIDEALGVPTDLLGKEADGNTATNLQKKIEELEDNALIMRKTECFTYRTEIIGFKETARRSNLTVEEVKEAIESGLPVGGYIFEFVG